MYVTIFELCNCEEATGSPLKKNEAETLKEI